MKRLTVVWMTLALMALLPTGAAVAQQAGGDEPYPPAPDAGEGVAPTEVVVQPGADVEEEAAPSQVVGGQPGVAVTGFEVTMGVALAGGLLAFGGAVLLVARHRRLHDDRA